MCEPQLREANESYRPFGDRALEDIVSYCRVAPDYFRKVAKGFHFDFCPLLPYWTAWTAEVGGQLYIVEGPSDSPPGPGAFYHEALHHVINPLRVEFLSEADHLKGLQSMAQEQLEGNYPEWGSLVEECVVRTIDRLLGGKYYKRSEEQIQERIQREYKLGFILCPALYEGFARYEKSGEPLERYFPRLFSGIDSVKEKNRWKRFWADPKNKKKGIMKHGRIIAFILILMSLGWAVHPHPIFLPGDRQQSRTIQASGQEPMTIVVDPRIELMSIIFRLAGNYEYDQGGVLPYVEDINAHFGRFKNGTLFPKFTK
jgi:hypothetical protein